jgi:protein-tyrosine phosphatase
MTPSKAGPRGQSGSLHWPRMATILLVCTGNICRSPMAEAFIRYELEQRGLDGMRVESSGVQGWADAPATMEALNALREQGLDLSVHRARRLDAAMVESADLVLALSSEHRDAVEELVPAAADRTFTLKELVHLVERATVPNLEGSDPDEALRTAVEAAAELRASDPAFHLFDEDVGDPIGLGIESYRAVAVEIQDLSRRLIEGLFAALGPARLGSVEDSGSSGS